MKTFRILLLTSTLTSMLLAIPALAAEYNVDASHSHVGFNVRHLVGHVPGEFKDFEGTFQFDPKNTDAAGGNFVVKTASINTNNAKRDEHLKSPDFFDVAKYPTMAIANAKLKAESEGKYKLTGDVTLHGVTKPVTFDVDYNGVAKDPWGNMRSGFTATTKLNRKDFGIVWNKSLDAGGTLLGDDVEVKLDIEAVEKSAEAPKADAPKKSKTKK